MRITVCVEEAIRSHSDLGVLEEVEIDDKQLENLTYDQREEYIDRIVDNVVSKYFTFFHVVEKEKNKN